MKNEKIFIEKIVTNTGDEFTINYNDIVVFVGPNNSGKSQCLKDIFGLSSREQHHSGIVVKQIYKKIENLDPSSYLKQYGQPESRSSLVYSVMGKGIFDGGDIGSNKNYGLYRDLFIADLTTENRLSIVKPPVNGGRNSKYNHPIQYAGYDEKYRKWLSSNFKKAFGLDLNPNILNGNTIPLCIGDNPKFGSKQFDDEMARLAKLEETLNSYDKVHNQGDGYKSFVGIILYLMLPFYKTYLIDEPESFLHQPQATMMGRIIADSTQDRQCFISTHSECLIKGLLDAAPNRVKVIRVTRENNNNRLFCLDNKDLHDIWSNPLLRHSDIMSGLFYNNVVICESDADCKLYSVINDHLKEKNQKYSETLFIHCGGKHRMSEIVSALKSLGVNTKAIVDIDILDNGTQIEKLLFSMGGNIKDISKEYSIFLKSISSNGDPMKKNEIIKNIENVAKESQNIYFSDNELKRIKLLLKPNSSWESLKENGVRSVPSGEATKSIKRILDYCKDHDIFVVPVGELESFVKEVGGHGPQWVNTLLENYTDLDDSVYNTITQFVASMKL